jgi:hypothetical protein
MIETYPVCLTLGRCDHWLAWYSDSTGSDKFLEVDGALVWTKSEGSLSKYLNRIGGWRLLVDQGEEALRVDIDDLLRSLEDGLADHETLLTLWNLFTDLSNTSRNSPVFPFAREVHGTQGQYDALFSRTGAGRLLDKPEESVDLRHISSIIDQGVKLLEWRLKSGLNPEQA